MIKIYDKKELLKSKLPEYLKDKGIDISKPFRCLNPKHQDKKPSMSYWHEGNRVLCFSCKCKAQYDLFDLIGLDYDLSSFPEQYAKACELFNIDSADKKQITDVSDQKSVLMATQKHGQKSSNKDFNDYLKKCAVRADQTSYFKARGISAEVVNRFNLGFDPDCRFFKASSLSGAIAAVIIPRSACSFTARNVNTGSEDRYRKKGSNSDFFNEKVLAENKEDPVIICEGEFDALSFVEAGFDAVALGSVANIQSFVGALKKIRTKRRLIINLDQDESGLKGEKDFKQALSDANIGVNCEFKNLLPESFKDANDALCSLGKNSFSEFVKNAVERPCQYESKNRLLLNSLLNALREYKEAREQNLNKKELLTALKPFDSCLGKGLYSGLYILGAVTGIGKTDLFWQFAENLAVKGNKVLFISLEMGRKDLLDRLISRTGCRIIKKRRENKLEVSEMAARFFKFSPLINEKDKTEETEKIYHEAETYIKNRIADNLYIFDSETDLNARSLDDIVNSFGAGFRLFDAVFIDYLQIIPSEGKFRDQKSRIDEILKNLKKIVRSYQIPVLVLSSIARSSYANSAALECFKESGDIEYIADVLLTLNKRETGNGKQEDKENYLTPLNLVILKNRNGKHEEIPLLYDPSCHEFYYGKEEKRKNAIGGLVE